MIGTFYKYQNVKVNVIIYNKYIKEKTSKFPILLKSKFKQILEC